MTIGVFGLKTAHIVLRGGAVLVYIYGSSRQGVTQSLNVALEKESTTLYRMEMRTHKRIGRGKNTVYLGGDNY